MLEWIKNNYKSILHWLYRNITTACIIALCIIFLMPTPDIVRTIFFCVLFEAIALILSNCFLHLFTNINFIELIKFVKDSQSIKKVLEGDDGKITGLELLSYAIITASILASVHLLVGITVLSIYFTQIIN